MTDEVSMAAAASIPASLVRLPLWYTGLTPRLIVIFATCTYMYAVSIVRGWRLGAGESVRAGIRCEGLSEEHERKEDAER